MNYTTDRFDLDADGIHWQLYRTSPPDAPAPKRGPWSDEKLYRLACFGEVVCEFIIGLCIIAMFLIVFGVLL